MVGYIDITTRSLSLTDGANLTATVRRQGNGGNINIKTGSLSVTNGAQLSTNAQGRGDAGDVTIDATDTVIFDGVGRYVSNGEVRFNRSQATSRVNQRVNQPTTVGNGGNINITTSSLFVRNGAQLNTSTEATGDAGNITIDATDTVSFDGQGIGGDILFSTALTDVRPGGVGNAGNIDITTGSLSVTNRAQVSTTSVGSGAAGNIEVAASSIRLDNFASLSSDTIAGQGNIILNSKDLVLRRGSNITTDATGTATGGNITIDTDNLVAL